MQLLIPKPRSAQDSRQSVCCQLPVRNTPLVIELMYLFNLRKAPQYPWPCPLHDALAACEYDLSVSSFGYLVSEFNLLDMYLTSPPPEALHSPVPPEKIVLAGDSAGAGLCITLLTLLRDLNIKLPAGAVLISPWVDLTHSFPSVMTNTKTVSQQAHILPASSEG